MPDAITVREPAPEDLPRIARLAADLGYPSTVAEVERRLAPLLGSSDHRLLVAVDERGEVVGWVHAVVNHRLTSDPHVQVAGLVVDERCRGRGVGSTLLAAAERWTRERGIALVRLRSNVVRQDAHRFYLRAGYETGKSSHLFVKRLD